jgi:sporulation protein YlmC with PRC-barrel domain
LVSVDSLYGKNVIGAGGTIIGEVKGAEVNTSNWQVTHLQIKLSSTASENLGLKKLFGSASICMPVTMVSAIGDVITIGGDLNELSTNPGMKSCPD